MPDEIEDGWELLPNGAAYLTVDGRRIRLRACRLGWYREMFDLLLWTSEETAAMFTADRDWFTELGSEDEWSVEVKTQALDRRLETADKARRVWFGWARRLVVLFAADGVPLSEADEDLPMWLGTNDLGTALIEHWRSTPTPSGAR